MFDRRSIATAGLALTLCVLAAASVVACDDDDAGPTRTAPALVETVQDAAKSPDVDIRTLDLEALKDVQALLSQTGGLYVQENVIYFDLTGDGADEAIVPVSSGGTLGDIAFIVLTSAGGGPRALLTQSRDLHTGLTVAVIDGKLVETRPEPGPDDPECCPSMLRRTTYSLDGVSLTVESQETIPNPEGGVKATPDP